MNPSSIRFKPWLFWQIAKTEAKRFTHYPIELVAGIARLFGASMLLAFFWYVVGRFGDGNLDSRYLLSYYLITAALAQISFTNFDVASSLLKRIKYGTLNADLIRPADTIFVQFARFSGWNAQFLIVSIILMIVALGFIEAPINPLIVAGAVFNMVLIGISINIFIGAIGFYVVEASGIKNALQHLARLLQGILIPLSLMPLLLQDILLLTPFPYSMYVPVSAIQGQSIPLWQLLIGFFWGVLLLFVSRWFWKRSLRRYEAVGI